MNRTLGGIPIIGWIVALGAVVGGSLWLKKRQATSGASSTTAGQQPQFTQAQEVQDFQIFSSLTSAQQASDLNMVSELASLFSGGSSSAATGSGSGGGGAGTTTTPTTTTTPPASAIPSPAPTGTAPPATVPASNSGVPGVNYSAPQGINDPNFLTTPATGQISIGGQSYPVGSSAANAAAVAAGDNPLDFYQL